MWLKKWGRDIGVGCLMGIGAIAPGISGGALAVLCGYYARITEALTSLFRTPKKALQFLIPLGIGVVIGILIGGRLLGFLFDRFEEWLYWGFAGLIAGTLPSLWKEANREGCRWWYGLCGILGLSVILLPNWLPPLPDMGTGIAPMLLAGAILGAGTIIPGVSSTCLLVYCGLYTPYLEALNALDIARLWPVALGCGVAILLLAGAVNWCYKKAYGAISYAVLGFLCGSAVLILPEPPAKPAGWLTPAVIFLIGSVLSFVIARTAERKKAQNR